MSKAQEFYNKARQCVGGLYVWGGQGHLATEAWLKSKAKSYPQYFDGGRLEMMLARVAKDPTLRAWDCSGLVCWALAQVGAVESKLDTTAQGLYANHCDKIAASELQTGDLLFRYSGGKMVHVGIYAPGASVEAAGGAYGVVECKGITGRDHVAASHVDGKPYQLPEWTHYGRLKVLAAVAPEPTPEPAPVPAGKAVPAITTGDVRLRKGPSADFAKIATINKGGALIAFQVDPVTQWRVVIAEIDGEPVKGYMSDKYIKVLGG